MKPLRVLRSLGLVTGMLLVANLVGHAAAQGPAASPAGTQAPSATEIASLESRHLANIQQLTFEGKSGEGYFSPDGRTIVFQSIRGSHPFYQIYTKALPAGQERMISTGKGRTTCAFFHPSGQKLIYASSHLDPDLDGVLRAELQRQREMAQSKARRSYNWDFDPQLDIFECDLDGSNLRRLTATPGYDAEGSYSPDGKSIVYTSFQSGSGNIWVMDADGKNPRQITDSPGYDGGPFFSPDGKRILFRGEVRRRHYLQLFVVDSDGKNERQLTSDGYLNWGPYWHPDGKRIIYATSEHGHQNYELYLLNIETGQRDRVTYTPGADVLPVFSPDGKKLMWTSNRGKNSQGESTSQLFIADWVD